MKLRFLAAVPRMAILSLSVPPDVKIMLSRSALIDPASFSLESSTASKASLPNRCIEDGFPKYRS